MKFFKRLGKKIIVLFSLIIIQTVTYYTIAPKMLRNKLMPDFLVMLNHFSDSLYVQDFEVSECASGPQTDYYSFNLKADENIIKEKFNVKFVEFASRDKFSWDDTTEKNFRLTYHTISCHNLICQAFQSETLVVNKDYSVEKEDFYVWILFFWFRLREQIFERDLSLKEKPLLH